MPPGRFPSSCNVITTVTMEGHDVHSPSLSAGKSAAIQKNNPAGRDFDPLRLDQDCHTETNVCPIENSSNQSGSDSGFGYTNSISSDNSLTCKTEKAPGVAENSPSIDAPIYVGEKEKRQSRVDRDEFSDYASINGITDGQNDNASKTPGKAPPKARANLCAVSANPKSASSSSIIFAHHKDAHRQSLSVSPQSTPKIEGNLNSSVHGDQIRPTLGDRKPCIIENKQLPCDSSSSKDDETDASRSERYSIETSAHIADEGRSNLDSSAGSSTLKSALKKSCDLSSERSPGPKHKDRKVSFNQTVIVFCEELESLSPTDRPDSLLSQEDPTDQNDTCNEPSPDIDALDQVLEECVSVPLEHGYARKIFSNIVGKDPMKLSNNQLFGLLRESELLNVDGYNHDVLSDLTLQRLNSSQSFVDHGAMSDSDSDSSVIVDEVGKKCNHSLAQPHIKPPTVVCKVGNVNNNTVLSRKEESPGIASRPNVQSEKQSVDKHENIKTERMSEPEQQQSRAKPSSLPARMKVSTVDSHHKRQQSTNPSGSDDTTNNHVKSTNYAKNSVSAEQAKICHIESRLPTASSNTLGKCITTESNTGAKPIMCPPESNEPTELLPASSCNQKPTVVNRIVHIPSIPAKFGAQQKPNTESNVLRLSHSQPEFDHSQIHNPSNRVDSSDRLTSQDSECHVCRAIELGRLTNLQQETVDGRIINQASAHPRNSTNDSHPRFVQSFNKPPNLFNSTGHNMYRPPSQQIQTNQSCISCREVLLSQQRQNQTQPENMLKSMIPNSHQHGSIACQLIYVLDQNGNRVRALQIVRPNVSDTSNRSLVRTPANQASCRQIINNQNANPSFIKVVDVATPKQIVIQGQFPSNNNGLLNGLTTPIYNGISRPQEIMQPNQHPMQPEGSAPLKNHTVYYVRQPLLAPTSHSTSTTQPRSFPAAHEIRRLDGINGPQSNANATLTQANAHKESYAAQKTQDNSNCSIVRSQSAIISDNDSEDPSFGFSRRPAVKVVSGTVNH